MKTQAQYMREWRARHPEQRAKSAAYSAEWRKKNPEKLREQWERQAERRRQKQVGPRRRKTVAPCVKCGSVERYPSGSCKPCTRKADMRRQKRSPRLYRTQLAERQRRYRERLSNDQHRERNRKANLSRALRKRGLTLQQFQETEQEQGGACAICAKVPTGKHRLHIDHDHTTGRFRALLCGKCNTAIGLLNEDPALFQAATDYLTRHKMEP